MVNSSVILGITKYNRGRLQSTIGLKMTKYDKAGLQIAIVFGLKSAICLDYKLRRDYKAQRITKWYSTLV